MSEVSINWTSMNNSSPPPNSRLLETTEESCGDTDYIVNKYEIPNYGVVDYVVLKGRHDQDFRKARAMIPFDYLDKSGKDFNWKLYQCDMTAQKRLANAFIYNFSKFEERGKGLYIYSEMKGSGKTMLSCCLLNELINSRMINGKFITVLDFIELTKKGFRELDSNVEIETIFKSRILILDDLGVQMKKEWIDTVLYRLINYRMVNKLVTILTSNLSVDKLKIDDRISDRIFKMTIPLILPEVSIRNMISKQENAEFLNDVMKQE